MKVIKLILLVICVATVVFLSCNNDVIPTNEDYGNLFDSNASRDFRIGSYIRIDDVKLFDPVAGTETIYENAEDGKDTRWYKTSSLLVVNNVFDSLLSSFVIELHDNYVKRGGFYLVNGENVHYSKGLWNNKTQFNLEWKVRTNSNFNTIVMVYAKDGTRTVAKYLIYQFINTDLGLAYPNELTPTANYIAHGIGSYADNEWHTFNRDIKQDLADYEPTLQIVSIVWFRIQYVDDNVQTFDFNHSPID